MYKLKWRKGMTTMTSNSRGSFGALHCGERDFCGGLRVSGGWAVVVEPETATCSLNGARRSGLHGLWRVSAGPFAQRHFGSCGRLLDPAHAA
jgi:hypothetical protein